MIRVVPVLMVAAVKRRRGPCRPYRADAPGVPAADVGTKKEVRIHRDELFGHKHQAEVSLPI